MVNLKEKPFYLNEEEIKWVEDTIAGMALDEKTGQLFTLLKAEPGVNEEAIKAAVEKYHQGGHRWQGGNKADAWKQNMLFQRYSKVPVFIAANCDEGGNGCFPEGTFVATAAEAGAAASADTAYYMGYVAAKEASAIGVNWLFNPVADIFMNWRNTIVNTRSFGSDTDKVIENIRAYIRGVKAANPNMACTCKHFPGDGVDELDPHLALAQNTLSPKEWEETFGRVYQTMIDEGLETIMTGQIALPKMSRKLRPGIKGRDIMPASLAPELLTDLLREKMGFNGVIISDASHMIGMAAVMKREDAVPRCFAAGCDMFLFANDIEEDMAYFKAGLEKGIVTEERFSDALHRIIGMKAHLKLYRDDIRFTDKKYLEEWVGTKEHHSYTVKAADEGITLVKDTDGILPISTNERKRALLVYVQSTPNSKAYSGDPVRGVITEELEAAGFQVDQSPNYYDLEVHNGVSQMNFIKMLNCGSRESFKQKYDVVFLFINVRGYAQENVVRMRWSCNHSCEMPWYVEEVPTVAVSLNYTNHLIDIPQVHTYVNAYGENRENIRAAIEKICGKSEFKGNANETVFCGREDTRY